MGSSYTEYDCAAPGAGWTQETLSQYDRVATGPGPLRYDQECRRGGPASLNGTVYVEGNLAAPGENAVLAFRYCDGALPPSPVARYPTGGSGSADLYNLGILDADQQLVVNDSQTLLFAVNQGSDSIAAFHIGDGGLLTPVAGSPFPSGGVAPTSVGVSGNILVVANKAVDGIRNLDAVAPNYATFTIQSDGSLSPTGSTIKLAPLASPTQAYVAPKRQFRLRHRGEGGLRAMQSVPNGCARLDAWLPRSTPQLAVLARSPGSGLAGRAVRLADVAGPLYRNPQQQQHRHIRVQRHGPAFLDRWRGNAASPTAVLEHSQRRRSPLVLCQCGERQRLGLGYRE